MLLDTIGRAPRKTASTQDMMKQLIQVCGKNIEVQGRLIRLARLSADGFEFLENPEPLVDGLRKSETRIDLFTFIDKVPEMAPKYSYPIEWDNLATLRISTFDEWWTRQVDGKTRNMVRKAYKRRLETREVPFDETLVSGIWKIYNECPIRQGKRFTHYGKDIETVRRITATFLETSIFIGAFLDEQLIGFVKLTNDAARSQATVIHIVAMAQHRDKAPTNALIAQAIRSCAERGIPYLVYANFAYGKRQRDSLSDFKAHNGFQRIDVPRYYVPLTLKGWVGFRLGVHRSLADRVPAPVIESFRELRSAWYRHKNESLAEVS